MPALTRHFVGSNIGVPLATMTTMMITTCYSKTRMALFGKRACSPSRSYQEHLFSGSDSSSLVSIARRIGQRRVRHLGSHWVPEIPFTESAEYGVIPKNVNGKVAQKRRATRPSAPRSRAAHATAIFGYWRLKYGQERGGEAVHIHGECISTSEPTYLNDAGFAPLAASDLVVFIPTKSA